LQCAVWNRVHVRKSHEQNYTGLHMTKDAEDYAQKARQFADSPINDIFNTTTVSELQCAVCRFQSVTFGEVSQISLELFENRRMASLQDCFGKHFDVETLTDSSRWNCPRCRRPQIAQRQTRIWRLPQILVIHLKRFSMVDDGGYVKNEINVDFQTTLNMTGFLHPDAEIYGTNYSLYAVTNHSGRLNSGHYTSYARNPISKEWLKFDDEYVQLASIDAWKTNDAYILFYTNV